MSDTVITVDKLGKAYVLGAKLDRHATFRDVLANMAKAPVERWRKRFVPAEQHEHAFWAVKDVSFDVKRGEVVGLVGRNGAGKSTLLKLLSRITEPSEGVARLKGRVASLLEVGTGFHPELTGRENIFMNGAILGMKRVEIKKKFDQIVEFAEVSDFLDTPVKHYSSGMFVRLAFAVAAHLEPEILVVDEVLAVGDAAFQRKCLGKMKDVAAGEGRTVLFVSHNMQAVSTLTNRCVLLQKGRMLQVGPTPEVINEYLKLMGDTAAEEIYTAPAKKDKPKITRVELRTSEPHNVQMNGRPMEVHIELNTPIAIDGARISFHACNRMHEPILYFWCHDTEYPMAREPGKFHLVCKIPKVRLFMGDYTLRVHLKEQAGGKEFEVLEGICPFEVVMYGRDREGGWFKNTCTYLEDGQWTVEKAS